jgi:hypothetical protein
VLTDKQLDEIEGEDWELMPIKWHWSTLRSVLDHVYDLQDTIHFERGEAMTFRNDIRMMVDKAASAQHIRELKEKE